MAADIFRYLTLFLSSSSYLMEFGFTIPERPIMVDDIRVRGCGKSGITSVYKTNMRNEQAKPVMVYHGHSCTQTHENALNYNLTGEI